MACRWWRWSSRWAGLRGADCRDGEADDRADVDGFASRIYLFSSGGRSVPEPRHVTR